MNCVCVCVCVCIIRRRMRIGRQQVMVRRAKQPRRKLRRRKSERQHPRRRLRGSDSLLRKRRILRCLFEWHEGTVRYYMH